VESEKIVELQLMWTQQPELRSTRRLNLLACAAAKSTSTRRKFYF